MVVALITAGGIGSRFHSDIPKQFVEINGKPLIIYTLEKFQKNKNIDKIIVSCLNGWEDFLNKLKEKYNISKLEWIAMNGTTQPESIRNCVNLLRNKISINDIIVIHAGNRPLVCDKLINNSIIECKKNGNSVTFIPCPELLISRANNNIIKRDNVIRVQTPQTFRLASLIECYDLANKKGIKDMATTCDLMIKLGKKINFIDGSQLNIKITYPEDLVIFKALLNNDKTI